MAEIDRFRPDDRRQVEALYRRVFGPDAADANRLRWDWQYRRNPQRRDRGPLIWLAREGSTVIGQYATMPVRSVAQRPRDRCVVGHGRHGGARAPTPGPRRRAVSHVGPHTGAALGLGLSAASHSLFRKMRWPNVGPVPCLVNR